MPGIHAAGIDDRLARPRAAQSHPVLAADIDRAADVVGPGAEVDDLARRAAADGRIDLCRRRPGTQGRVDRRPVRDAAGNAAVGPVDPPVRRDDRRSRSDGEGLARAVGARAVADEQADRVGPCRRKGMDGVPRGARPPVAEAPLPCARAPRRRVRELHRLPGPWCCRIEEKGCRKQAGRSY